MSSSQLLGRRKRPKSSLSSRRPRSRSSQTSTTRSTKSTGPYDRAFQQHLIDHNFLPDGYEYPDGTTPPAPENMDEILDALSRHRASLSPSRFTADDFRQFKRADTHAHKERDVTVNVIPIIGSIEDSKCTAGEIPFTNLDSLTDGTLVPANPDKYYGARPEQLKRSVREELNGLIVPSTQHDLPIAPNYFLQVKGPDGTPAVALRQAWYDSIIGARGIDGLQSYKASKQMFDNKAYTLASVYQGGQLKIYASQPIPPREERGSAGYVMTQVKAYALTSDVDTFRRGAAAYRNGRDWAKDKRNQAIQLANAAAEEHLAKDSKLPRSVEESSSVETLDVTSQETAASGSQTSDESESTTQDVDARRPAKRHSLEKHDAGKI